MHHHTTERNSASITCVIKQPNILPRWMSSVGMAPGWLKWNQVHTQVNITHSKIHSASVCVHTHTHTAPEAACWQQFNKHTAINDLQKGTNPLLISESLDKFRTLKSNDREKKSINSDATHTLVPPLMSFIKPGKLFMSKLHFPNCGIRWPNITMPKKKKFVDCCVVKILFFKGRWALRKWFLRPRIIKVKIKSSLSVTTPSSDPLHLILFHCRLLMRQHSLSWSVTQGHLPWSRVCVPGTKTSMCVVWTTAQPVIPLGRVTGTAQLPPTEQGCPAVCLQRHTVGSDFFSS